MQGLVRYSQAGAENQEEMSLPSSETGLMSNQARYQPLPTAEDGTVGGRQKFRCTQSVPFNLLVGAVVCLNALVIGLEADLGLLGPAPPRWTGLVDDINGLGIGGDEVQRNVEAELAEGIKADKFLKRQAVKKLNSTLHKDIVISDLELSTGARQLRPAAYTVCEYFFVVFFTLELLFRFCDLGCKGYLCNYPWMILDVTVVATGFLDVVLPFILEDDAERLSVLAFLRVMRVLRLLKLFQVVASLQLIGRAFLKAFGVVLLVGIVVLILDFSLAVLLTSLIGQRSGLWGVDQDQQIENWFGSVGRSMQTLFAIQTLTGWDHIVEVLGSVIPTTVLVPSIVLYMMLSCFAVVGLITSSITDSFMVAQRREQRIGEISKDVRRRETMRYLGSLFSEHAKSSPGLLSRAELENALAAEPVDRMLQQIDVVASNDDLLKFYDRLNQDPALKNKLSPEDMAQAATSLVGSAQAFNLFELKCSIIRMQHNAAMKAELASQEAASMKIEMNRKIAEVQKEVSTVRQEMKDVMKDIVARYDAQAKLHEQERQEHRSSLTSIGDKLSMLASQMAAQSTIGGKIDTIASQLATQSAIHGKVDALTVQVATQATVGAKLETIMGQVQAQLTALNAEPKKMVEEVVPPHESRSSAEPAAEPESTSAFSELGMLSQAPLPEAVPEAQLEAAEVTASAPEDGARSSGLMDLVIDETLGKGAPKAEEATAEPAQEAAANITTAAASEAWAAFPEGTTAATPEAWVAFPEPQAESQNTQTPEENWASFPEAQQTEDANKTSGTSADKPASAGSSPSA